jgi:hypothetical protein
MHVFSGLFGCLISVPNVEVEAGKVVAVCHLCRTFEIVPGDFYCRRALFLLVLARVRVLLFRRHGHLSDS